MRYTVALPAKLLGGVTAFTPNMTRLAASGAQQYKESVNGQPGTAAIAAPTRDTAPSPDLGDIAQMGGARSSDAPDVWYPQNWYETGSAMQRYRPGAGMPIRIWSDNLMPVPAQDPRGLPAMLAFTPQFLGQQQVAQPRVMPTWGGNV
jgi:hypothetical protein